MRGLLFKCVIDIIYYVINLTYSWPCLYDSSKLSGIKRQLRAKNVLLLIDDFITEKVYN